MQAYVRKPGSFMGKQIERNQILQAEQGAAVRTNSMGAPWAVTFLLGCGVCSSESWQGREAGQLRSSHCIPTGTHPHRRGHPAPPTWLHAHARPLPISHQRQAFSIANLHKWYLKKTDIIKEIHQTQNKNGHPRNHKSNNNMYVQGNGRGIPHVTNKRGNTLKIKT